MNKGILIKYLKNQCSKEEFEAFENWVKKDAHNKESKDWGYEQWRSLELKLREEDSEKYSALLHKIHHEINLQNSKNENRKVITVAKFAGWLSRAAAILFLPLLGVVFYLLSNSNFNDAALAELSVDLVEVISPIGSRTVVQLSDGTEVNLNYGSKIKYPKNFTGNAREITLTGEGYFDVAHDPEKPFVVKTEKLNIKAIGTEFNVQAYPDNPIVSTTLVNGKVIIEETTDNKAGLIGTMVPGQHIDYHTETGKINSNKGSVDKYIAWKNGKMIFDNTSISEVARELSRKYNVDIIVEDGIKDLTYTVTFVDDPLFLILDLMTEITPIKYVRSQRKKLPDGTFSKQEIRIVKR
ncbi:MAG TPA: FecR domain-containing protein [Mariniphaga sp.]|nr:FecR domain-containing protein [Mariniphaga sp.]